MPKVMAIAAKFGKNRVVSVPLPSQTCILLHAQYLNNMAGIHLYFG